MAQHQDREHKRQEIWRELNEAQNLLLTGEGAVKERGLTHREFAETVTMLERFQVAGPTDEQTQAVLTRLAKERRRIQEDKERLRSKHNGRFADQLASTHHTASHSIRSRVLRALLSQTSLFSPLFWIVSAIVIIVGAAFMPLHIGEDLNSFFLTLSIVSGVSVFYALRSYGTPMADLEATFPMNPVEIALGRICIILMYDFVLAVVASVVLHGAGLTGPLGLFIVSWLVPLCLCTVLAFVLIMHFGLWTGAVVSVALWGTQLLMGRLLGPFYVMSGFEYEYWGISRWIGAGLTVMLGAVGYIHLRKGGSGDAGRQVDGDPA